jgi:putative hydrolase
MATLLPGLPSPCPLRLMPWSDGKRLAVTVDYHMHTTHTDGTATCHEMAQAAAFRGISEILLSEHVRHTSTYFAAFSREVRMLNVSGVVAWVGAEAKILGETGELGCAPEIAALCDALIGSVHSPPASAGGSWSNLSETEAVELEFRLALAIVAKSRAHILGHPMGMVVRKFQARPYKELQALADACREHGKAFELNGRYCASAAEWLAIARKAQCAVSIGSDAHTQSQVGSAWRIFSGV